MILELVLLAGVVGATFAAGYYIGQDKAAGKYQAVLADKNSALMRMRRDRDRKAEQLEDLQHYLRRQHRG